MKSRWRITGRFTTAAPLHVGSGTPTTHDGIHDGGVLSDVQAVVKDWQGRPCIPGTALKGVLRAWAEQFYPDEARFKHEREMIARVFGNRNLDSKKTVPDEADPKKVESGWAEFCNAFILAPTQIEGFDKNVPYWNEASLTGIASHVSIDRHTGAAAPGKLFYLEFVPEGVTFAVEIDATRLTESEVAFLLAVLDHGAGHATHPYQFGANGANGWGRVNWRLAAVTSFGGVQPAAGGVGFACCTSSVELTLPPAPSFTPPHVAAELALAFQGPFLVNDTSRVKSEGMSDEEKQRHTNFTPLRRAKGDIWLPASSFRGALRSRAEFLAASLGIDAASVERVFGHTSAVSRLTVTEFCEVKACATRRQDFVAIDRFTGGAAEGAKFDATYADRPTLRNTLTLDLSGLEPCDVALLAAALRDVCRGVVTFGFGAGKGYGEASGTLRLLGYEGVDANWAVPPSLLNGTLEAEGVEWLSRNLAASRDPSNEVSAPAPTVPASAAPAEALAGGFLKVASSNPGFYSYTLASTQGGKGKPQRVKNDQVSAELLGRVADQIAVEFTTVNDLPARIRTAGGLFLGGQTDAPPVPPPSPDATLPALRAGRFANPYYFLRLEDRSAFAGGLGDAPPPGHERYLSGLISGTIRVRLTSKTPLLICGPPDTTAPDGHKTYPVLMDGDMPLLAASSVRGMVRAAYEAVTNSRLGVFPSKPDADRPLRQGNARRFGYRMNAGDGLSVVPVRIEGGVARLMFGTNPHLPVYDSRRNRWVLPGDLLHAAWVNRYRANVAGVSPWAVLLDGQHPSHEEFAHCWLEKIQHSRPDFAFWAVRQACHTESDLDPTPPPQVPPSDKYHSTGETCRASGFFCVTNQNIKNKHDERYFFVAPRAEVRAVVLADSVKAAYRSLIRDYQAIHEDELATRWSIRHASPDTYLGGEPGRTAWSRHVYDTAAVDLGHGTLCYAAVRKVGRDFVIDALYPVTISRKLYDRTPLDLLPPALRPATSIEQLSPADRVFGWVSQDEATAAGGETAYRGHVRFGPVTCTSGDAVERFAPPKVLAILGQPKPAQGRFYLGRADGSAQPKGLTKEQAGYRDGNRVRGPKVYPHHRRLDPARQFGGAPSSQNRSVRGQVRPGSTFEFDINLMNLSRLELGGLAWLLSLPADHFLRLGLGKPLGFGSVRAEVIDDGTHVADGVDWTRSVSAWDALPPKISLAPMVAEFEGAMTIANPKLLEAFRQSAKGFADLPVHYPQIGSEVEHFEWFVANEKPKAAKWTLPDLTDEDPSLPNDPT